MIMWMLIQVFGEGTPDLPAAGVGRQGISLGHLKLPHLSEYGNAFQIPVETPSVIIGSIIKCLNPGACLSQWVAS